MKRDLPYTETLLHWLWKNRYLQNPHLSTNGGKKVSIHHPGYSNASDGPDFTNARLTIGNLRWHGDIEIHWSSKDWFNHNHHSDPNYNQVILHVVFKDENPLQVHRQDDTIVPTLYMKRYLSKPLQYFFRYFRQPDMLPCAGSIASIPRKILNEQFEDAHNQYFELKINDLLRHFDASLPISQAWKHMLITALFDGLGISHNRRPMRKLAGLLLNESDAYPSVTTLTTSALRQAGIDPENEHTSFRWKRKGSRPANHPKTRIKQACQMMTFIQNTPLVWWLRTDIKKTFQTMLLEVDTSPGVGSHRSGVLFGIVWIPCFYLLGELTGTKRLRSSAKEEWLNHRTALPASITKPFYQANIPEAVFEKKLGIVHQYRTYCKPHQCQQCKVFNYIISS